MSQLGETSSPGRWLLRTTGEPGEILVDGQMAGGAAPMPFPVPAREDRITQADIEDARDVLWRSGLGLLDREQSYRLALSVCEALLKGGHRA